MSVAKIARDAGNVLMYRATWGGSQNFLGARWVERCVANSPAGAREQVALRFLSLSPHYFYDRDVHGEDTRNRNSRQALAEQLIAPHLTPESRVLDYGSGRGARPAAHASAVDISRGVLACARAINGHPNITFSTPDEFRATREQVDLAYSF